MNLPRLVLDSNVIVSALRSRRGASFHLLRLVDQDLFESCVSVALVLEYEDAAMRLVGEGVSTEESVRDILDFLTLHAEHQPIHYSCRPFLPDPADDKILDVAVSGGCEFIVTFNRRDFAGSETFGVRVVTPGEMLRILGELS